MSRRPNILFIISDDHRYSASRAFGDHVVRTPRIDELVAQGTAFDRTYHFGGLTGGVCVPARACLMAGANPFRALASKDLRDSVGLRTINPTMTTLPEQLRQAGYTTYHVGKWHNDTQSFHRSFDGGAKIFIGGMSDHYRVPVFDFDPSGKYPKSARYEGDKHSTELFGGAAIEFLRDYASGNGSGATGGAKPFFLYLAFTAPHDPRTPPPEYAALYPPEEMPLPPNYLPEHPFDNGEMRNRDESLASWPRSPEIVRQHIADYYGMITHLDHWIGRVLDTLAETGMADDTIVVYTADHGLAVGQHGLIGKQNLYEHSARVPCIIRGPGIAAGRRSVSLIHTPDLHPTLCELVGVPTAPTVETHSLVPLLRATGEPPPEGPRSYVCQVYKGVQRMVTDGHWKLIRYYHSEERPGVGTDALQLFDLENDPWELTDLSSDPTHAARIRHLASLLDQWQHEVGDPMAGTPVVPTEPDEQSARR
ncbi:MAG TPA: sulfatase-like hydrolase/transferase [Chloroflexota bacterium]|nr:sulfatase-like hydrolase/transferase [Chloroflexota bacterium]